MKIKADENVLEKLKFNLLLNNDNEYEATRKIMVKYLKK
jgi:hypothetical protein